MGGTFNPIEKVVSVQVAMITEAEHDRLMQLERDAVVDELGELGRQHAEEKAISEMLKRDVERLRRELSNARAENGDLKQEASELDARLREVELALYNATDRIVREGQDASLWNDALAMANSEIDLTMRSVEGEVGGAAVNELVQKFMKAISGKRRGIPVPG